MKSKILKVKNVPHDNILATLRTKPISLFVVMLIIGFVFLAINQITQAIGALLCLFALYGLFMVNDRMIIEFTDEFMIVYDESNKEDCKLLYYDEILSWDYITRSRYDCLVVEMIDGTSEKINCYSKHKLESILNVYAPNKRRKHMKGRGTR